MRKFIAGLVVGVVMASAGLSFANSTVRLFVNGREIHSDVPPQIIDGRTLVPARALAEALGATVGWDAEARAVVITSEAKEAVTVAPPASSTFKLTVLAKGKTLQAEVVRNQSDELCLPLRTVMEFVEVAGASSPSSDIAFTFDGELFTREDFAIVDGRTYVCELLLAGIGYSLKLDGSTLTVFKE